jgi:Protein of unknown function (DUF2877)
MLASCSSAVASVIRGPEQPAAVLGVAASALYVQTRDCVLAVVTADAVRLPCAVVLPVASAEFSLRAVAPDGVVTIGGGAVRWTSRRPVSVEVVREWQPARARPVVPRADRLAELRMAISDHDIGVPLGAAPQALLGLGPGLTPSGDDVLAGYLLGCLAFGLPAPAVEGLHRTTALSAALVRHAQAGECVPEVAAVVTGLGAAAPLGPVLSTLLRVGHTSGAALAAGLLLATAAPAVLAA